MAFKPLTFFVHLLPLKVSAVALSHFSNYKFVNNTSLCHLDVASEIDITDIKISIMDRRVGVKRGNSMKKWLRGI
jgi:hypothetical protein